MQYEEDGYDEYYDIHKSEIRDPAIRALCVELLTDARVCLEYAVDKEKDKTKMIDLFDTMSWIESSADHLLSFEFCCDFLEFDVDAVRERMLGILPDEKIMKENWELRNYKSPGVYNRGRRKNK